MHTDGPAAPKNGNPLLKKASHRACCMRLLTCACTHSREYTTHVAVPWYISDTCVSASSMRTAKPASAKEACVFWVCDVPWDNC